MKKCFLCVITLIMLVMGCAGNAKPADSSGGMTLDQALKEAAARIDERIAAGSKIALLNFNSPHDKFSGYVLDELTANLVDSGKLIVVDRKEVDLIRSEFDFQFSGEVGNDSMQELGRMLGAQSIISGSLTDMGGFYRIVIRVLNVQNASVEVQYRTNIVGDSIVAALLTGGRAGETTITPQRTQAIQTPAAPVVQVPVQPPVPAAYKIGDKGPAGGIVFYDKFSTAGGWRYLEAAPPETEHSFPWGDERGGVIGATIVIGGGRQNTDIILAEMQKRGVFVTAAQYCHDLEYGGYSDWFLPSGDELNLMFLNLKAKGLGGFSNYKYWSSYEYWGAYAQNFANGTRVQENNNSSLRVRAVRAF